MPDNYEPISAPFADRQIYEDAEALIANFGSAADIEAAARAHASRSHGNLVRFCHWRQIERLIPVLTSEHAIGTLH